MSRWAGIAALLLVATALSGLGLLYLVWHLITRTESARKRRRHA